MCCRGEAEAVRNDAHTAAQSRQHLEASIQEVKSEIGKLKDKREVCHLPARVRSLSVRAHGFAFRACLLAKCRGRG